MSAMFFALQSCSSLGIIFVWRCLSIMCMSLARDSANGEFVSIFFPCSLSSLLLSTLHMVVPSGLCKVVCVGFVGYCMSS